MRLVRYISVLSFFFISVFSQAQNLNNLKSERKKLLKEIELTSNLLKETSSSALSKYNELTVLRRKINLQNNVVSNYRKEVNYINNRINELNDSINLLQGKVGEIKADYAKVIYHTWQNRHGLDQLMYVLAGKDINQSYRRLRYLSEYNSFRKNQAILLENTEKDLEGKIIENQKLKKEKDKVLSSERSQLSSLQNQRTKYDQQIKELNSKKSELKRELRNKQQAADRLNKAITKIVEKEVSKTKGDDGKMKLTPEEKLVASNFVGNKGKLPWPVERGIIISRYGKQINTILKSEYTFKNGIDIQTDDNGLVRSIYNGVVTGVYAVKGSNQTILIKHGNYYSLYSNLSEVFVKKGDKIDVKEEIGKCYTDDSQKCILHFQIWKETEKQNPEKWITN